MHQKSIIVVRRELGVAALFQTVRGKNLDGLSLLAHAGCFFAINNNAENLSKLTGPLHRHITAPPCSVLCGLVVMKIYYLHHQLKTHIGFELSLCKHSTYALREPKTFW